MLCSLFIFFPHCTNVRANKCFITTATTCKVSFLPLFVFTGKVGFLAVFIAHYAGFFSLFGGNKQSGSSKGCTIVSVGRLQACASLALSSPVCCDGDAFFSLSSLSVVPACNAGPVPLPCVHGLPRGQKQLMQLHYKVL